MNVGETKTKTEAESPQLFDLVTGETRCTCHIHSVNDNVKNARQALVYGNPLLQLVQRAKRVVTENQEASVLLATVAIRDSNDADFNTIFLALLTFCCDQARH